MVFKRHPSYATLNQFADGELEGRRYRRVASHLADCSRCRQEVAFIRRAGDLARSLETPAVPTEILDRVLERRTTGERVLLPPESPGAEPEPRRRTVPAIAALLVLFMVGLFFSTNLLEADRGGLTIQPEHPRAAETLTFQYDGGREFADREYLKLRVRYRTASGRHWEQLAGILTRGDEGVFRTRLPLPDSVVFAAFAVEDLHGDRVDSNNRELWEALVHGDDGRPTVAALGERLADLYPRNPAEARQTARTMTELYPDSPRGWSFRWTFEQEFAAADSLREVHRARFQRLERALLDEPPADPSELAHLAWYAIQLDERASADYWTREAERRGAEVDILYQARAVLIRTANPLSPVEALRELEALWKEAPFPVSAVAAVGWRLALQTRSWPAAMQWLPRARPGWNEMESARILGDLQDAFETDRVLEWALVHQDQALLAGADHRPLYRTRDAHRRHQEQARQRMLTKLARMALDDGRRGVAAGLALEALPLAWETPALETIGSVLLETGDTADAVTAYARAAADPLGTAPPDVIARAPTWAEALELARGQMTRYVLRESVVRYLPDDLERTGPRVVAFQFACSSALERLNAMARSLDGVAVTVYSTYDPDATPARLRACGLDLPVRLDSTGEISHAFRVRGFPTYFVTDADGRIRFENSELDDVPRQLMALRRASGPMVTD